MNIGNGVRLNGNPMRQFAAASVQGMNRSNWNKRGALLNIFSSTSFLTKNSIPSGMSHPNVWVLPIVAGGLASRFEIEGTGSPSYLNLAGGVSGASTIAGSGDISSAEIILLLYTLATITGQSDTSMELTALAESLATIAGNGNLVSDITSVLNAIAALSGSSDISADAQAILAAIAALSGSGSISTINLALIATIAVALSGNGAVSTATLNAITQAISNIAGSGSLSQANIDGLGIALSALAGTGSFTVGAEATGTLAASISTFTELSPESLADKVKEVLLGTQLDGYAIEDIIKLTSAVLLGKSSGGATNPVFRSIDDQEDRVSGAVDGSGNRTDSVLSP